MSVLALVYLYIGHLAYNKYSKFNLQIHACLGGEQLKGSSTYAAMWEQI